MECTLVLMLFAIVGGAELLGENIDALFNAAGTAVGQVGVPSL